MVTNDAVELNSVKAFLKKHPEFKPIPVERLESGETAVQDEPMPMRFGGQRVLTGYEQLPQDIVQMWPPNDSRTIDQRLLTVRLERILTFLPEGQQDLLRRVYWERQRQEDIATDLGVSQQAVSQRVITAEAALKRAIALHGGDQEVLEITEGEL